MVSLSQNFLVNNPGLSVSRFGELIIRRIATKIVRMSRVRMEYRNIGKTFEDESVLLRRISELKQDNEYYVSQNLETCHQFHLDYLS